MDIKERIIALLSEIGKGLYEKEAELRLGLLAFGFREYENEDADENLYSR